MSHKFLNVGDIVYSDSHEQYGFVKKINTVNAHRFPRTIIIWWFDIQFETTLLIDSNAYRRLRLRKVEGGQ